MKCCFTYNHFKECINLGKKLGFSFYSMHDYLKEHPKKKFIVMRHDVDLSLKHALIMAKTEKYLGIKSTYFIRNTGIYNPFYEKNLGIMRQISKLGHEIGIHYDSGSLSANDFKSFFLSQKKDFELFIGKKIFGAAVHKRKDVNSSEPGKLNIVEGLLPSLDLEYDAYSDAFMKDIKFISDSKCRWREGCMCNHIKKETKLCILTHPIWWSATTTSLVSVMEELLE